LTTTNWAAHGWPFLFHPQHSGSFDNSHISNRARLCGVSEPKVAILVPTALRTCSIVVAPLLVKKNVFLGESIVSWISGKTFSGDALDFEWTFEYCELLYPLADWPEVLVFHPLQPR
jgi:hypothetical protein